MHMLALPIAGRELLVLSRAAAMWRYRLGTSGVVFVFGILFALMYHYLGQIGINEVMKLIGIGLSATCMFTGASLTADSIAEEKRAGTLGLLFLTNLSPLEIVLGKLVAQAMMGFYTVLCALPLLSMSMIFGGMRFADVLLYMIAALNVLFFSAAVGLFASSICRDKGKATAVGTFIVLFFWLALPALALTLKSAGAPLWVFETLARLSVNLSGAFTVGLARLLPSTSPWWSLLWPLILAWAFISLAAWRLRGWHDEAPAKRWRLRDAWKAICYGGPAARLKLRRKLLDRNAFMWLASRDRLQVAGPWIASVFCTAIIALVVLRGAPAVIPIGFGITLAFLLQLVLSHGAVAQLLREYEQGTLEMILSTPLSAHEVVQGQFAAARRQFGGMCATALLLLCAGLILLAWQGRPGQFPFMIVLVIYSALFLLQCYAIGWLSMWSVVKATDPKKAVSNGFFLITIFPALMCGAIAAFVSFVMWLAGVTFFPPAIMVLIIVPMFFLLAFSNCIYWLRRARRELPAQLRLFAFRHYTPDEPITLFGKLGRFLGRCLARARAPGRGALLNAP